MPKKKKVHERSVAKPVICQRPGCYTFDENLAWFREEWVCRTCILKGEEALHIDQFTVMPCALHKVAKSEKKEDFIDGAFVRKLNERMYEEGFATTQDEINNNRFYIPRRRRANAVADSDS